MGLFEVLKFVWRYSKNERKKLYFSILGIAILSLIAIPIPVINGMCIDTITQKKSEGLFLKLVLTLLCVYLIQEGVSFIVKKFLGEVSNSIVKKIKDEMLEKVLYMSQEHLDNTNSGYIYARINESENIRQLFSMTLVGMLTGCLDFIISIIAIFFVDVSLAMASSVCFLILFVTMKFCTKKLAHIIEVCTEKNANVSNIFVKIIECAKITKIFNLFQKQIAKEKKITKDLLGIQNKKNQWNVTYSEAIKFINLIHTVLILFLAGTLIFNNKLTIGTYTTYTGYSSKVFSNTLMFSSFGILINPIKISVKRIKEFLEIKEEKYGEKEISSIDEVSFHKVFFSYSKKDNEYIIKNFTENIGKNDFILFKGNNGTGKTTLVNLILGLYKCDNGQILINKSPIENYNIQNLRKLYAYMPQERGIFEGSLLENLLINNAMVSSDDVIKDLQKKGLAELLRRFDNNLQFKVSHDGTNLSEGQKQILKFLRVALAKCDIVILDEPTNFLDRDAKKIVIQFIRETLAYSRIVILITHDKNVEKEMGEIITKKIYFN